MKTLKLTMTVAAAICLKAAYDLTFQAVEVSGVKVLLFSPDMKPGATALLVLVAIGCIALVLEANGHEISNR